MIKPRPLAQTFLAIALIAGSAGAEAAGDANLGRWIAAQGNAALQELQHDLKRDLAQRLQPMLPGGAMVVDAGSPLVKVGNDIEAAPATIPDHISQSL
jgi:hypothetical protein